MFPSILIQLENGPNEFYFLFLFRPPTLTAKKISKTKNKKTMAERLNVRFGFDWLSGFREDLFYMLRPSFLIFCFTDFFRKKLVSEDEIKIKIKFIRTIFQLN